MHIIDIVMYSVKYKSYLCRKKSSVHGFQIRIMKSNYPLLYCYCYFKIDFLFEIINLEHPSREDKIMDRIKKTQGVEGREVATPQSPHVSIV